MTSHKRNRKKTGRQGRSRETRLRIANLPKFEETDYRTCPNCNSYNCFVEDYTSGDLICRECGVVREGKGLGLTQHILIKRNPSKKYQRIVHFKQRLAMLLGRGPQLSKEQLNRIWIEIEKDPNLDCCMGKKSLAAILSKIGMEPKLANHWIQVRQRLALWPYPLPTDLLPEQLERMKMRYLCIEAGFVENLGGCPAPLGRKNIINLNYTLAQLLRLETPDFVYKYFAPFLPQLTGKDQPAMNNRRWQMIVEWCSVNRAFYTDPKTGLTYRFDWPYLPITKEEITSLQFGFFF